MLAPLQGSLERVVRTMAVTAPPTTTTAPVQNHQVFQKGLPASVESLGVAVEVRSTPAGFGASLGGGAIAGGIDAAA
jgi:hypothetical protein